LPRPSSAQQTQASEFADFASSGMKCKMSFDDSRLSAGKSLSKFCKHVEYVCSCSRKLVQEAAARQRTVVNFWYFFEWYKNVIKIQVI
jgi:hypothetical protein